MFCSKLQYAFYLSLVSFREGRVGGGLKGSLTLLNWSFKWRLIQNHNQNHHFEDNALFSGGDAQKRNARIFEHSIFDSTAFPHVMMFHDYNYTFRPTCRKLLSPAVAKSHFFWRLLKATFLAQAWNFSSVCLKAMLFPSPFFLRYLSTAFHKSQFSRAIHK